MIFIILNGDSAVKIRRTLQWLNLSQEKREQASKGNVVAIQIGSSLNIDIYHKVRLVNIEDYNIDNYDAMYGFIAGMLASDYDCTDIFVDGILKICGRDMEKVGAMFDKIAAVSGENTHVTFTISAEVADLTENIKKYLK